jgi:hypothetical protein
MWRYVEDCGAVVEICGEEFSVYYLIARELNCKFGEFLIT